MKLFCTVLFSFFLLAIAPACKKQVEEAKDVATSVQSSVFNLSIMIATWIGGMFLVNFPASGVKLIVCMSLVCFILAIIIAFLAKRTLRSSAGSSPNP